MRRTRVCGYLSLFLGTVKALFAPTRSPYLYNGYPRLATLLSSTLSSENRRSWSIKDTQVGYRKTAFTYLFENVEVVPLLRGGVTIFERASPLRFSKCLLMALLEAPSPFWLIIFKFRKIHQKNELKTRKIYFLDFHFIGVLGFWELFNWISRFPKPQNPSNMKNKTLQNPKIF